MNAILGTYPFGSPLRAVVQEDRSPKDVFVLGVYASAVHAAWSDETGRMLVRALAVASEPEIFWDGRGAENIIAGLDVPPGAGSLRAAGQQLNGPSGRSLEENVLRPLGLTRARTWLCDLVPHTCLNKGQESAIEREYEPKRTALGLPPVDIPVVPKAFSDAPRRTRVLDELRESRSKILVLLGDEPVRHFLAHFEPQWRNLRAFGGDDDSYGRLRRVNLDGHECQVLPLVHVRQAAGLGRHSPAWRALHGRWAENIATDLLR